MEAASLIEQEEDLDFIDGDGEVSELSRSSSMAVPEEFQVVQVGENKELMEQKRQMQWKLKQRQKDAKKLKEDKKAGKAPPKKVEVPEPEPEKGKSLKDKQVRGKKQKLQKIKDKYAD